MGWVVNATPRLFYPAKDPVPILEEAGWAPGPSWMGAENFAPTGFRCPDRPARRKSLYLLRSRGPLYGWQPIHVLLWDGGFFVPRSQPELLGLTVLARGLMILLLSILLVSIS
jgi:hypothetical protein